MKHIKFILISILLLSILAACGSNDKSNNSADDNNESVGINMGNGDNDANDDEIESDADEPVDESEEEIPIFEIGQTALIERSNDVKYEVTVDDFELVDDFNGENIKDRIVNANENNKFSVITYTVKNVGSIDLVPDEETVIHFGKKGDLAGEPMDFVDEDEASEALEPGDSTEVQQYVTTSILKVEHFLAKYDISDVGETWFKLPLDWLTTEWDLARPTIDNI